MQVSVLWTLPPTTEKLASTKSTGGGGFTFADKVAGWFLIQVLGRKFPFESEPGPLTELHFETSESGNALDDLMLVMSRDVVSLRLGTFGNNIEQPDGLQKCEHVENAAPSGVAA